jgi:hypothetical protein
MRKILLATAATLGAGLAFSGAANAQPVKPVAPGSIVVHVNGYFQFDFGAVGSTDSKFTNTNAVASSTYSAVGTYKDSAIATNGDARIYAGVDAATLDDVIYGAQIEARTGFTDAGVGQNGKVTSTAPTDSLYVQRAYGYVGTKAYGTVRYGQTDSAFTLLQTGVIEAFGDGTQFSSTAGNVASLAPGSAGVGGGSNFIYADQSNLYATDKVVYITPAVETPFIGGKISGAFGYEANSNGLKEGYNNYSATNDLAANLSASPYTGDIGKRRINTIDAAVLYTLKANDVAYKLSAGLLYGAPIAYDGNKVATGALKYGYDQLDVWQLGGQATYGGFTIGANVKAGQTLDGYAFKPKGARDAAAYIIGGNYVVGPYVVGASFFDSQSAGNYTPGAKEARTLNEYGAAVGGNYVVGKDLSLFVQYEYDARKQFGNTGINPNNPSTKVKGAAQAQIVAAGATLKW